MLYNKTPLKITFVLSFQLECLALGPHVTDHGFKRPEHHWAEEAEREENVPVGSLPCCGGSSGEAAGKKEVRLVWLFHFRNSVLTFSLPQTSVLWCNWKTQNKELFLRSAQSELWSRSEGGERAEGAALHILNLEIFIPVQISGFIKEEGWQ